MENLKLKIDDGDGIFYYQTKLNSNIQDMFKEFNQYQDVVNCLTVAFENYLVERKHTGAKLELTFCDVIVTAKLRYYDIEMYVNTGINKIVATSTLFNDALKTMITCLINSVLERYEKCSKLWR